MPASRLTFLLIFLVASAVAVTAGARPKGKKPLVDRAQVAVNYPKAVQTTDPAKPRWEWEIEFSEKGGQVGYTLTGSGHIVDSRGLRWANFGGAIDRGEVRVEPGGSVKKSYWCRSPDHSLCNGAAIFTWTGKDDRDNHIHLTEQVRLLHRNCPGAQPKK